MDLPEAVRTRLVSLVAGCLDEVGSLPPSLKRVAGFAPARRARLGASAIVAELTGSAELRERVLTHVRPLASDEPVDAAAVAWLAEDREGLDAALARLETRAERPARDDAVVRRLRERVDEAERALREQRRAHRETVEALKAELATVRRTLGETRARDRDARAETAAQVTAAQERAARAEREARQARAEVARLEEQVGEQRRSARSERDDVTVRTRLLLDTLADAAAGLRRELALPPTSGTPGERVEGAFAPAEETTVAGPPPADDPARLATYLALPRARLVVDGYNVTKSVWPTQSLEAQRSRLLTLLGALVARTGAETTVVFDGAGAEARGATVAPRGVRVVFSPAGVIADDVIRDLVDAEPSGRVVVVVTDDRALGADVRRAGARLATARSLAH
ncbi:NYN domain-containing protein [Nocardioides flavescens]|uniref:YacP-like NYN domain-containing protein n=1 Tax=Nocardioides flavescens TaxID=2691959 RepID=A0A6L7F4F0_9ACTN|nr:hypothetical protein [Nocardioides flavescens]